MSNAEFASSGLTAGQLNAIVKKLGGYEAALNFLRGELIVSEPVRKWREEDEVIYFSVTSDNTTGLDWIARLERRGFHIGEYARWFHMSDNFSPTTGITFEIAVLKGSIFSDNDRRTKIICIEADKRQLTKPRAEIACLIREKFTDREIEAMGLQYIIAMHEHFKDFDGNMDLLYSGRGNHGRWLGTYWDDPLHRWSREGGFAFVVSQVGP